MSIIAFTKKEKKETGQSISVAAIATHLAINHNYKILIVCTDYDDKSLEECFFLRKAKEQNKQIISQVTAVNGVMRKATTDIASGIEGLIRTFASNRADANLISNYAKPILKDRLDLIESPKTTDLAEYRKQTAFIAPIVELANTKYDMVFVDIGKEMPDECAQKIYNISTIICTSIAQNQNSIDEFYHLKEENELFQKSNVRLLLGKYNINSRYSRKNIARYLREKDEPFVVPYNILFSDYCSEAKLVDYIIMTQGLRNGSAKQGKDAYFADMLYKTAEDIDDLCQAAAYGII